MNGIPPDVSGQFIHVERLFQVAGGTCFQSSSDDASVRVRGDEEQGYLEDIARRLFRDESEIESVLCPDGYQRSGQAAGGGNQGGVAEIV